jgi:rhodanese-related sulfurtransferase
MLRREALLILTGASAALRAEIKALTHAELDKLLQDRKNLFFLDVREPDEIKQNGSIEGYVNIPVGQLDARMSEIPKDKLIVTACARGRRATTVATKLEKAGYRVAGACGLADYKGKKVYPKN